MARASRVWRFERTPSGASPAASSPGKAKTDKKGDWSVLGITRGLWIFEFSADGHFPHVVAVPVMMMESSPLATVPWYLVVTLQRESEGGVVTEPLRKVVERLASGSRDEALAMFHQIPVAAAPAEGLCAAGDVALLLRDSGTARGLFAQVAQARPDWPRAQIGFASAAILQGDYGAAGTAFAKVRDATTNQEVKQAMSAVIKDLMLISREQ